MSVFGGSGLDTSRICSAACACVCVFLFQPTFLSAVFCFDISLTSTLHLYRVATAWHSSFPFYLSISFSLRSVYVFVYAVDLNVAVHIRIGVCVCVWGRSIVH